MKLVQCYQDSFILESAHKDNKKNLTIVCHGSPGFVIINNKILTAPQLYRYIPRWTALIGNLHKIHLVACESASRITRIISDQNNQYSALTLPDSIGFHLSKCLPSVYIKCYAGKVTNECSTELVWPIFQCLGSQKTENIIKEAFRIVNDQTDTPYHTITYINGEMIKQKYNIVQHNGREYGIL